ncbi:MAG TPA: tRNA (adenosine(37)-N6)-threonylcarbamoyltransferase complex ATPase subunit type 1 TsaE [Candidatus Binatia bacterium]|nr:tRNA (adenosine(37)-N6)-threonylcarbamoyltransferase complex ATPase subunit type 1 TsaE [Candidatus Binatia bacterium]
MATDTRPTVELSSSSPEATRQLAARLAAVAAPGDVLCLWGDLGAGKTVFAKGFGSGLGIEDTISSPTFVLMGEYVGRLPLFHIDLYRLERAEEALDGGLLDERQALGVVLVEWPDRLGDTIPVDRLDVEIESPNGADEPRRIRLTARGGRHRRYIDAAILLVDGLPGGTPAPAPAPEDR